MFNRLSEMVRQRRAREDLYSQEDYWDAKAEKYDDTAISMWPNKKLNQLLETEQKEVIGRYLGNIEMTDLLDLGCGTGRYSRWFVSRGAKVVGVDFSEGSLTVARRLSNSGNPIYRHGSVFELTEEFMFDVAFVMGVLTVACRNDAELLDALRRIRRSLKPGGRLLLTEPIHRGFLHRVLDLGLPQFLDVMRKAGFEVKAVTPLHFWPMRLALSYVPWPAWVTVPIYHLGQAMMKLPGLSRLGDYWAILAYPSAPVSE